MAYPFSKRILAPLLAKRIVALEGIERIPSTGPALVVANHIGYQDPVLMFAALVLHVKRKVHAIAKWKSLRIPGLKRWLGIVPLYVDRQKTLLRAKEILDAGGLLLIYPEGTVNFSDTLLRAKSGVARLALWTGAPVFPVGIRRVSSPPRHAIQKYAEILTGKMRLKIGDHMIYPKKNSPTPVDVRKTLNNIMDKVAVLAQKRHIPIK